MTDALSHFAEGVEHVGQTHYGLTGLGELFISMYAAKLIGDDVPLFYVTRLVKEQHLKNVDPKG